MNKRRVTKRVLKTNKRTTQRNKRILSIKKRGGEINKYVSVTLEQIKKNRGYGFYYIDRIKKISIHRYDDTNNNKKIYSIDCVYDIINRQSDPKFIKSVFSKIVFTILPSNNVDYIKKKIQSDIHIITFDSKISSNVIKSCSQLPNSIELAIVNNTLTVTPTYNNNVCQVSPITIANIDRDMERGFMDLDYDNERSKTIMDSIEYFDEIGSQLLVEKIKENMSISEKEKEKERMEKKKEIERKIQRDREIRNKLHKISMVTQEIKNNPEYIKPNENNENENNENENNENEYLGPLSEVNTDISDMLSKRKMTKIKMDKLQFTPKTYISEKEKEKRLLEQLMRNNY